MVASRGARAFPIFSQVSAAAPAASFNASSRLPTIFLRSSRPFHTTLSRQWSQFNRCQYGPRRIGYSYQRFQNTSNLFQRWAASPTFHYQIGGIGMVVGGVYISNLETVPVSGRRRFNIMGPDFEAKMARTQATDVLKMFGGEVLPDSDPRTRSVKRVLNRLIPSCGLTDLDWEVYVVDNPDLINAMVVPGGKVFVFTGILPLCQDDDGLAAVLGHEISHVVARHVSEKFSRNIIFYGLAICADLFLGTGAMGQVVIQYLFEMPNGRKQETEADYMGLMLMAQSCYDPKAAMAFWGRMAKKNELAPPEFLSTHPASANRVEKMRGWLPEAEEKRSNSDCHSTLGYAEEFRKTLPQVKW